MNHDIFDDISLEQAVLAEFGLKVDVAEVIARQVTTGVTSAATLFKTPQALHFAYVSAQGSLTLGEVQKMVCSMGLEAEAYLVPRGDLDYFKRIGVEKFKQMFPGKYIMSAEDTRYYETLAPYNPALVRLAKIKGEILGYDIAAKQWRKVKAYAYSKMPIR